MDSSKLDIHWRTRSDEPRCRRSISICSCQRSNSSPRWAATWVGNGVCVYEFWLHACTPPEFSRDTNCGFFLCFAMCFFLVNPKLFFFWGDKPQFLLEYIISFQLKAGISASMSLTAASVTSSWSQFPDHSILYVIICFCWYNSWLVTWSIQLVSALSGWGSSYGLKKPGGVSQGWIPHLHQAAGAGFNGWGLGSVHTPRRTQV